MSTCFEEILHVWLTIVRRPQEYNRKLRGLLATRLEDPSGKWKEGEIMYFEANPIEQ